MSLAAGVLSGGCRGPEDSEVKVACIGRKKQRLSRRCRVGVAPLPRWCRAAVALVSLWRRSPVAALCAKKTGKYRRGQIVTIYCSAGSSRGAALCSASKSWSCASASAAAAPRARCLTWLYARASEAAASATLLWCAATCWFRSSISESMRSRPSWCGLPGCRLICPTAMRLTTSWQNCPGKVSRAHRRCPVGMPASAAARCCTLWTPTQRQPCCGALPPGGSAPPGVIRSGPSRRGEGCQVAA